MGALVPVILFTQGVQNQNDQSPDQINTGQVKPEMVGAEKKGTMLWCNIFRRIVLNKKNNYRNRMNQVNVQYVEKKWNRSEHPQERKGISGNPVKQTKYYHCHTQRHGDIFQ